jgi:hypothetical protein
MLRRVNASLSGMTRRFWTVIGVLLALCATAFGAVALIRREELHASFSRPDGQYRVLVFRRMYSFGVMPGQGGDVPGRVVLVDRSGEALREAPVEMVQLVENVEWLDAGVFIFPCGEWTLPP